MNFHSFLHRGWPGRVRGPILWVLLTLLSVSAHAATITWDGGSGGLWDDPMKWSPQQVPGAGDTAVIGGTEETTVNVMGSHSVDVLVLQNPNTVLRVVTDTSTQAFLTVAHGFENRGTIELRTGINGSLARLTVSSGTLTNAVGGIIREVEDAVGARQLLANLDNRGTVLVNGELFLRGNVANSGTVNLTEGKRFTIDSMTVWTHRQGAITGSGTLVLASGSRLVLEDDFTPGGFILNAPSVTIDGPGRLMGPDVGEFVIESWTINAPLVASGDMKVTGNARVNGPLHVAEGKKLRVVTDTSTQAFLTVANGFENRGTIELRTGINGSLARLTVSSGTLTNAVGGIIRGVEDTVGLRQLMASLENRGLLEAEGTLSVSGTLLNTASGILAGNGRLDLSSTVLIQGGIISPGALQGILTITGGSPLTAASRLDVEIGGFTAGTQHDQLVLANPATLDGAIRPVLLDGFVPKKDDAFSVLTYPSRTGTFASIDNPLPERIAWDVRYGPTSAQLVVLNTAPTLAVITDQTLHELTPLALTATATDVDLPAQALTFSLVEAPAGMAIDAASGGITWTPTEAQGPGVHNVTVRVTDSGTPALGHTTRFAVTVHEVNVAPQPALPGALTANEEVPLIFTVAGTDADLPGNTLTYTMVSGPEGATFDPATREFRWTPTEAQGPGTFAATFRVTDASPDAVNAKELSTEGVVSLSVQEVNQPPALASISLRSVDEEATLASLILATDPDLPANRLAYSLDTAPAGMAIDPSSGAITWTPTEAQGPALHDVVVRVTDNGVPALSHTAAFGITVNEVNRPPALAEVPDATAHAGADFGVTLSATDPDLPANAFIYSLVSGPVGAVVGAEGRLEWTPALVAAGTVAEFTVRVEDGSEPALTSDRTFQVTVVGPVEILGTTRDGNAWTLQWRAVAGNTYRLVRASALPAAEWTPVPGEVTATGDTASKSVALEAGDAGEFFRVERVR
jgi:hypothetical protein